MIIFRSGNELNFFGPTCWAANILPSDFLSLKVFCKVFSNLPKNTNPEYNMKGPESKNVSVCQQYNNYCLRSLIIIWLVINLWWPLILALQDADFWLEKLILLEDNEIDSLLFLLLLHPGSNIKVQHLPNLLKLCLFLFATA